MKREVRHLESVFSRHHFPRCHLEWRGAVVWYHQLLGSKQRSYWSGRVLESAGDTKALWKTLSGLMSPPTTQTTSITPAEFMAYCTGKVDSICASTAGAPPPSVDHTCNSSLTSSAELPVKTSSDCSVSVLISSVLLTGCQPGW